MGDPELSGTRAATVDLAYDALVTGFSIHVFLPDGDPEGLRTVSKSHWTGQATMTKRERLDIDLKRPEFARTGVYVLVGPGVDNPSISRVYVGEGDEVINRIKSHAIGKDFWTELVAFTKTDDSLNKADVRYLESELIRRAGAANRGELDNGNFPNPSPPTEAEKADLDSFMSDMVVILRLLGITAFESLASASPGMAASDLFSFTVAGASGKGSRAKEGFTVRAGSTARVAETDSISTGYHNLRQQLISEQILVPDSGSDDYLRFAVDHTFGSPSAAGAVLYGGVISGPQNWRRVSDQISMKEIEAASLGSVESVAEEIEIADASSNGTPSEGAQ